jgi:hypothetical protein
VHAVRRDLSKRDSLPKITMLAEPEDDLRSTAQKLDPFEHQRWDLHHAKCFRTRAWTA